VREACHSGRGSTKGNNETRPQSPGAAALQQTQSAHSAPTLIRDQDPILVLVLCESTGQCLRDFANLAGGTQYAAECCVGSRSLSTIKVAGWLGTCPLSLCLDEWHSVAQFYQPAAAHILGIMDSFVEQQCTDSHVANASRRLHPAFRASSTSSGLPSRCQVS
jgi:hypothetical protein